MKISCRMLMSRSGEPKLKLRLPVGGGSLLAFVIALAVMSLAPGASAQKPTPSGSSQKAAQGTKQLAAPAPAPEPAAVMTQPVPPLPPPTPEQRPPSAPEVSYEDGQLTINADNSTLPDILAAVIERTGVEIEIPAGASRERMAVRLGPGPARAVLAALLSWTEFDYIIQASDSDLDAIQSVLLTPRTKAGTVVADRPAISARRLAPGYRNVADSTPSASEAPAAESPNPPQPAASLEPAAAGTQAMAAETQSASTDLQPPSTQEPPAALETAAVDVHGATAADFKGDRTSMVEELQRMYKQRQQIQQMQNTRTPAPN